MTAVQPCALLLRVGPDWLVEMASANIGLIGDVRPSAIVGEPLTDLIGSEAVHALRNRLSWLSGESSAVYDYGVRWGEVTLDIHAMSDGEGFLIEGELSGEPRLTDSIGMARSMSERLSGNDPVVLAEKAVRLLRTLTGYHRISLEAADGRLVASSGDGAAVAVGHEGKQTHAYAQMVVDRDAEGVPLVGDVEHASLTKITFLAPTDEVQAKMKAAGVLGAMSLPLRVDGEHVATLHADDPGQLMCGAERRSVAHLFSERLVARMIRNGWKA